MDEPFGIVVIADQEAELGFLLSSGHRLATVRNESLTLIGIAESDDAPDWLTVPEEYDESQIQIEFVPLKKVVRGTTQLLSQKPPALVLFSGITGGQGIVRKELDSVMQRVKCPVGVVVGSPNLRSESSRTRILVPFKNDENSRFALITALSLDPDADVTAALVAPPAMEDSDQLGQRQLLEESLAEWNNDSRVKPKLLIGSNPVEMLVEEAENHDTIVLGVSHGLVFLRALMGDAPAIVLDDVERELIRQTSKRAVVLRAYQGWLGVLFSSLFSLGGRSMPDLTDEERIGVYREIRRSARPTQDFFIMIGSSASIASIGMILNSPAIIIGAMLIAPLMSAIIGMGLAIVQGDFRFFGLAAKASLRGLLLAVLVGLLIGILDIGTQPTGEMLSRTEPSLLDFVVAMVSGFAAAYALCRKNVSAALPGVAIAVALVPPLTTVGLFAGMGMFIAAYGALLLFLTNLAAITLASGLVFTILGFHPPISRGGDQKRYRVFQRGFLIASLLVLAVFSQLVVLTVGDVSLSRMESSVTSKLNRHLENLDENVRVVQWSFQKGEDSRLTITAFLTSPEKIAPDELIALVNDLEQTLDRPVELLLSWAPANHIRSNGWKK